MPVLVFAGGRSVRVKGHVTKNGTYVSPHYRSAPDKNPYNNWSYPGNVNPYTGKEATGNPDTYLLRQYNKTSQDSITPGTIAPGRQTPNNIELDIYDAGTGREDGRTDNLKTCLTGKYPTLCKHSSLTSEQAIMVREAELTDNLRTCLTGKYPTLCKHSDLTSEQETSVREAELADNLKTCLTGKYPTLCKHSDLTPEQATAVREAELEDNLKTCLTGKYPTLCKHSSLTSGQAIIVRAAEQAEEQ